MIDLYVLSWIAVRDAAPVALAEALGLAAPRPATLRELAPGEVFIAPPMGPWTLALGRLELHEPDLLALSARFGEAQAFFCDGKRDAYGWTRAVGGTLARGVAYFQGEVFADGDPASPEPADLALAEIDEVTVGAIARAWSVHPEALAEVAAGLVFAAP